MAIMFVYNSDITAFESGFTDHLGAAIENLALVGFACSLGVQYTLGSFFIYVSDFEIKFIFQK